MSKRSKAKRDARQHKSKHRAAMHTSPVGGLFVIDKVFAAASDNMPLPKEHTTDIGLHYWRAFEIMKTSPDSSVDDWAMIASTMNIALMLAEDGYGFEHQDVFVRAQDGIARAYLRGMHTTRWRFDGEALNDIAIALDLHDQQCQLTTKADIKAAMRAVHDRIKSGNVYQAEHKFPQELAAA